MPSPSGDRAATIHDVARLAGVSIKTVSRVMRDEPHVQAATRASVMAAAQALRYQPHPSARNLAAVVSDVVGLVQLTSAALSRSRAGYEYMMELQSGAQAACTPLGVSLQLLSVPRRMPDALHMLVQLHESRRAGGLLVAAPACDLPGLLPGLVAAGVPHVAISPHSPPDGTPWVGTGERAAMRQLTAQVLARGHRRVVLLLGDDDTRGAAERRAGFEEAMAEAGLPVSQRAVEPAGFAFDGGREAAHRLLRRSPPPTAILACSDDCAAGVITAAHERGLQLPDELSVTGFDDADLARKLWPGLTTVRQPLRAMAEAGTLQLVARMQPARRLQGVSASPILFDAELVVRGSVAAAPDA